MGRRAIYWFVVVVMLAVLGAIMWSGRYPAHLTIVNNSGTDLTNVTVESHGDVVTIPFIANGSASSVKIDTGGLVTFRAGPIRWTSPEKLTVGRSLVIYVFPDGKVEARGTLGAAR